MVERCRAEVIERVEDLGPEPRNVGQENCVGRKISRRRTSSLAATRQAAAVSEERGTANDVSRRFRVRQISRLLLSTLRSPESVGISVRARGGPPLGCVLLQLFGYFLRGTRNRHFTYAPRIRPSPVKKPRFLEFEVPPVCGSENLPSEKCRKQKSPSFTAHFFAE